MIPDFPRAFLARQGAAVKIGAGASESCISSQLRAICNFATRCTVSISRRKTTNAISEDDEGKIKVITICPKEVPLQGSCSPAVKFIIILELAALEGTPAL